MSRLPVYNIVLAVDEKFGIGKDGGIPWHFKEDMEYFKKLTTGHIVIMGRGTWDSLPAGYRPLPNRVNIVVTSTTAIPDVVCCDSPYSAMEAAAQQGPGKRVFVIGGSKLVDSMLMDTRLRCAQIHLTHIQGDYNCDTFVPFVGEHNVTYCRDYCLLKTEDYCRVVYVDCNTVPEVGFQDLLTKVLESGYERGDRTGTGTFAVFGQTMEYHLGNGTIPLLTSKRVPWKNVIHELLWYLSGSTNVADLHKVGIHYWDANSSRDFLDKRGLYDYPEGELGQVYGYQWRKWGGNIDQIGNLIQSLREDPFSRRHIVSAWNVGDLDKMALPPCHCFSQFLVDDKQQLHCILYQRSGDLPLGVPFNIACYSILVHMLCHIVPSLQPGTLTHMIGDCHIYKNHVEGVNKLLQQPPKEWPTLRIVGDVADIDSFTIDNFVVENYFPAPSISFPMAV